MRDSIGPRFVAINRRTAVRAGSDGWRATAPSTPPPTAYGSWLSQQTIRDEAGLRLLVGDRLVNLRKEVAATKAPSSAVVPRPPAAPVQTSLRSPAAPPTGTAQRSAFEFQGAPTSLGQAGRFTVQTGAYAAWNSAVAKAGEMNRYGKARIVEVRDPFGRRLYTVRLGNYPTPEAAEALRSRLGRAAVVVLAEP